MDQCVHYEDLCEDDLKGGTESVIDCTTTYPGERCRYSYPSGPTTPPRGFTINELVDSGVGCSSAPSVSTTSNVPSVTRQRGEKFTLIYVKAGYDSDFLDDTALITAFDNAINPIKAMLGDTQLADVAANKTGQHPPKKKKHRKNRVRQKKTKEGSDQIKWHVGSKCRCKYSEDGLTYDATVVSLDDDGETCTVRYAYYDNEECQQLCDLIPPSAGLDAYQQNSSLASDVDSVDGAESLHNSQRNGSFKMPHTTAENRRSRTDRRPPGRSAHHRPSHYVPQAFPFPYQTSYPHMPPPFAHLPPPFNRVPPSYHRIPPAFARLPGVPLIPPPPPPMMDDVETSDADKEALYSMLISWYMSGYHTGYYEGLKRRSQRRSEEDDDSTTETASSAQ